MWPFRKKFKITGKDGKTYFFTAKRLFELTTNSISSDYNFLASVSELVCVCSQQDFPDKYSNLIKLAIIKCFSIFENTPSHHPCVGELDAVYTCYNTLLSTDTHVTEAKQAYIRAIIDNVAKNHFSLIEFNHSGPTYSRLCEQWKEERFLEFYRPIIDFTELRRALHTSFDKTMRDAEAQGFFKADYDIRFANMHIALAQLKRDEKEES